MMSTSSFINWFPVLPFILYWIFSFIAYEFGPFINPSLSNYTYLYFFSMFGLFIIMYWIGINTRRMVLVKPSSIVSSLPLKILNISIQCVFIGTLLLVVDRIWSGAGSFDLVVNEMSKIRSLYADNTTWITTIAVLPQSLRTIAFAAYFYCLTNGTLIKRKIHILMLGIILLDIINMMLTASRGILFWNTTYLFFYLVFCKRLSLLRIVFSTKYKSAKLIFIIAMILTFSYFYFVARNRTIESVLEFSGRNVSYSLKYPSLFEKYDYATIGASEQLFSYITHEFRYFDVILKNAEIFNFDPLTAMGIWVSVQITRLFPDYEPSAKVVALQWLVDDGLSPAGWPSIFGWPLTMFGVIGSILFFPLLGLACGLCVANYLKTNKFGWFLLVFVVYNSLNISFDWILRDPEQYVAIILAFALIGRFPRNHVTQLNHVST